MPAVFKPTDTLISQQWHLIAIGTLTGSNTASTAGIERVWADYTGAQTHVGIWDDGVEKSHWDLAATYDASRQITVQGSLNDATPIGTNNGHGTAVAGLIGASANGQGGVGVAFGSSLTGVRIFGGQDDINLHWSRYLDSLDHLSDFDVTNHSYGATPDFNLYGDVAQFEASLVAGRGGLGTVNVKSAGNLNVDGNGLAIDASRATVTVAALDATGRVANYSSYGAHVLLSAAAGSVTTDRLGTGAGYDGLAGGDYTNRFGGTSAAAPVTTGIIALMLDANPLLGWRDVQDILAYSAAGAGNLYAASNINENARWAYNGAQSWNGGGLHFSNDYGYGAANAFAAVRMAEVWSHIHSAPETSANEVTVSSGRVTTATQITNAAVTRVSVSVTDQVDLDHVKLTLELTHSNITDLSIRLISPSGTAYSVYDGSTGATYTASRGLTYSFGLEGFRGELSTGLWTVEVTDGPLSTYGNIKSVRLDGFGAAPTADNVYHFTEEVLVTQAQAGQSARAVLHDSDGGQDWMVGASFWRPLVLDLRAGATSTVASTGFVTLHANGVIENACGGDGNDLLIGNAADNTLIGMRGDDTLNGSGGNDIAIFGGQIGDYALDCSVTVSTITDLSGTFGRDSLQNIEILRFDDAVFNLSNAIVADEGPVLWGLEQAGRTISTTEHLVVIFNDAIALGQGDIVLRATDGTEIGRFDVQDSAHVWVSDTSLVIDPAMILNRAVTGWIDIDTAAVTDMAGNPIRQGIDAGHTDFAISPTGVTMTGTNGRDVLRAREANNTLIGLGGNDVLKGGNGVDHLDGGLGNDRMAGGLGDDVYVVSNIRDTVRERTAGGIDIVETTLAQFRLPTAIEALTYTGTGAFSGTGNALDNHMSGGGGNDVLMGLAGNDTLHGGAGDDVLNAGSGDDVLWGDDGSDVFQFATASTHATIMDFQSGSDRIDLSLIDADPSKAGNQAFTQSFGPALTGIAGELALMADADGFQLWGDLNGDGLADLHVVLTGVDVLMFADVIL